MSGELTPLQPGEIRFHQASPPSLSSGNYTLTAKQVVRGAKADAYTSERQDINDGFETSAKFTVSGPRFFLKPSDVYSVFPPAGQFGAFGNSLPHVVFARRTVPWERSIDGKSQSEDAPIPWLALLLLGRGDFADGQLPKVESRSVGALLRPGDKIQGPTGLSLEGGQSDDDLCNTIDLTTTLFAKIAPTLKDLPLLAHLREIRTGGKETLSLEQDGWFTVVIANRMPATCADDKGETNLVCLVSLEGFGKWLPQENDSGNTTTAIGEDKISVRLAVLASWRFTCHGKADFKARMAALNDKSLLALSTVGLVGADTGVAAVRHAFEQGYVGLNHTTRLGEKTVSWYRGPLVPLCLPPRSPYAFIPCADRALRYDFRDGLFAAEYAAAYELGRMMALQNRGFALAMYRHRQRIADERAVAKRQGDLERELSVCGAFEDRIADLLTGTAAPAQEAKSETAAGSRSSAVASASISLEPPKEVKQFLARAVLLYGVPFHYLVADERMLPPESIRFFYLDPGWIASLIQGATCIGRTDELDTDLDRYLRHHALDHAMVEAALVRGSPPACTEPKVERANWPLSGFLLRSEVIQGWQGVEMRAEFVDTEKTPQTGKELAPLRIDRLGPDVLLCIFNGWANKLTVKQPPEGLHFGLSLVGGRYQRICLRKVTADSSGVVPGACVPRSENESGLDVPMRLPTKEDPVRLPTKEDPAPTRTIRVAKLASEFSARLSAAGHSTPSFTSAEFAVEMIESPASIMFKAKGVL